MILILLPRMLVERSKIYKKKSKSEVLNNFDFSLQSSSSSDKYLQNHKEPVDFHCLKRNFILSPDLST
jgi:hypothetical protein